MVVDVFRVLVVDLVIPLVTFEKRKVYFSMKYLDADRLFAVQNLCKSESTTHCRQ